VLVAIANTTEADVSPIEEIDTSASVDAMPAISAPTFVASTHDVDIQSETEIATEQLLIRKSKRVMKRSAVAGNDEGLAAGLKRAKR
jgi:hypothetical protein